MTLYLVPVLMRLGACKNLPENPFCFLPKEYSLVYKLAFILSYIYGLYGMKLNLKRTTINRCNDSSELVERPKTT